MCFAYVFSIDFCGACLLCCLFQLAKHNFFSNRRGKQNNYSYVITSQIGGSCENPQQHFLIDFVSEDSNRDTGVAEVPMGDCFQIGVDAPNMPEKAWLRSNLRNGFLM